MVARGLAGVGPITTKTRSGKGVKPAIVNCGGAHHSKHADGTFGRAAGYLGAVEVELEHAFRVHRAQHFEPANAKQSI
jgi:hypothetical protein